MSHTEGPQYIRRQCAKPGRPGDPGTKIVAPRTNTSILAYFTLR